MWDHRAKREAAPECLVLKSRISACWTAIRRVICPRFRQPSRGESRTTRCVAPFSDERLSHFTGRKRQRKGPCLLALFDIFNFSGVQKAAAFIKSNDYNRLPGKLYAVWKAGHSRLIISPQNTLQAVFLALSVTVWPSEFWTCCPGRGLLQGDSIASLLSSEQMDGWIYGQTNGWMAGQMGGKWPTSLQEVGSDYKNVYEKWQPKATLSITWRSLHPAAWLCRRINGAASSPHLITCE